MDSACEDDSLTSRLRYDFDRRTLYEMTEGIRGRLDLKSYGFSIAEAT